MYTHNKVFIWQVSKACLLIIHDLSLFFSSTENSKKCNTVLAITLHSRHMMWVKNILLEKKKEYMQKHIQDIYCYHSSSHMWIVFMFQYLGRWTLKHRMIYKYSNRINTSNLLHLLSIDCSKKRFFLELRLKEKLPEDLWHPRSVNFYFFLDHSFSS